MTKASEKVAVLSQGLRSGIWSSGNGSVFSIEIRDGAIWALG